MNTIYTLGYGSADPARLKALAEERDLMILDIRISPRSRRPEWTKKRLGELLGERYIHLPELGNRNYKGDLGPDVIFADLESGLAKTAAHLEIQSVLLLCACGSVQECHRLPASKALAERTGAAVIHLKPGDLPAAPVAPATKQMLLW